jgi:hypothetical protein
MRIRIHITVGYTLRAALMASSASMEQWSFTGGRDSSCTNMPSENYSEKCISVPYLGTGTVLNGAQVGDF